MVKISEKLTKHECPLIGLFATHTWIPDLFAIEGAAIHGTRGDGSNRH